MPLTTMPKDGFSGFTGGENLACLYFKSLHDACARTDYQELCFVLFRIVIPFNKIESRKLATRETLARSGFVLWRWWWRTSTMKTDQEPGMALKIWGSGYPQ